MKRHALFCLLTTVLAAQALAPEVELSAEPHHHLTLENKYVRVYNVEVPPHTDTFMHWHRHDYIYVTLGPTEVVNEVKEKPPVTIHLEDGETHFSPAPFAHIARNQTGQPFRNVTIEIVDDENLRHATTKWDPNKNEDRALETFQQLVGQAFELQAQEGFRYRRQTHPQFPGQFPARHRLADGQLAVEDPLAQIDVGFRGQTGGLRRIRHASFDCKSNLMYQTGLTLSAGMTHHGW